MAAPASGSIIRVPGRLIWNPTNLGTTEPYGGTYLGTCRGIRFNPNPQYREIWAEELGSVVDEIYVGEGPCTITATVRYPDDDMLTTVAARAIASGSSGVHWLFRPGGTTSNTRAGTSLYDNKVGVLLFAPRAYVNHPMYILYRAIPMISEDAELKHSLNDEYGLTVKFIGVPSSNGRVYDTGRRANLVL